MPNKEKKSDSDVLDKTKKYEEIITLIAKDVINTFTTSDVILGDYLIDNNALIITDNSSARILIESKLKMKGIPNYKVFCFSRKSAIFFDRDEYARQNKK